MKVWLLSKWNGTELLLIEVLLISMSMPMLFISAKNGDYAVTLAFLVFGLGYPIRRAWKKKSEAERPKYSFQDMKDVLEESREVACQFNDCIIPKSIVHKEHGELKFLTTVPIDNNGEVPIDRLPEDWKLIYKSGVFG